MTQQVSQIPILKGDQVKNAEYRDALMVNMTAIMRAVRNANGYILTHPGIEDFATGVGIDRGGVFNERFERHYRVSGNRFLEVTKAGGVIALGALEGDTQASLAQSFNTQAIVSGGNYYLYDPDNGFREVTDADVGDPIDVTWVDNYYFFTDGEFIYHTDIDDEEQIDPLKFATSEFSPDKTLGVLKTEDNQVAVFNRFSTEWFVNRATENFAFQRLAGQGVKSGIVGTHCKTELDGLFFVLGGRKEESPSFHIISPGRAQGFATREIDKILSQYNEAELENVVMESRVQDRDMFIITHLPNETLLYNHTVAKKFGNEQAWSILEDAAQNNRAWPAINGAFDGRNGKWLYGDKYSSRIGQLSNDVGSIYGEDVELVFYSPFIQIDGASVDEIELDIVPGFVDRRTTISVTRTEDGVFYGQQNWNLYSDPQKYGQRYIVRRFGYIRDFFGLRFRTTTGSRLAFSNLRLKYG